MDLGQTLSGEVHRLGFQDHLACPLWESRSDVEVGLLREKTQRGKEVALVGCERSGRKGH